MQNLVVFFFILTIALLLTTYWFKKHQQKLSVFWFVIIMLGIMALNLIILLIGINRLPDEKTTTLTNNILIFSSGGLLINSAIDLWILSILAPAVDRLCFVKDNCLLIFETITQFTVILSVLIGVSDITSDEQKELLAWIIVLVLIIAPLTLGLKWKFKK